MDSTPPPLLSTPKTDADFLADNAVWQAERRQELLRPDGWTSLVGLHWLQLKSHWIGSSPGAGMRLEVGPPRMGLVQRQDGKVWFTPERGVALTANGQPLKGRIELVSDQGPQPTLIGFDDGKGQLSLIQRGERLGLRLKHADAPARLNFGTLEYWPPDPAWKITGRFVPAPAGSAVDMVDITGTASRVPSPGTVEFDVQGKPYRLTALDGGQGRLFLVLADATSGHGSYAAGRFLDVDAPDPQGRVVLDFNRLYNPPCAFTGFATCPLPPPENRLPLALTAGERAYVPGAAARATSP
ncbi:MAG: DUF1684 domain-containing protein [Pseudoxanthomonas sp.]